MIEAARRPATEQLVDTSGGRWGDLLPRAVSAIVMIVLAISTTVAGGPSFAVFWLLAGVAIVWEWQRLIGARGSPVRTLVGGCALVAAVVLAEIGHPREAVLALGVGALGAAVLGRGQRGLAGLGVIYAGALALGVLWLRNSAPLGMSAVVWLFAVVWCTDILAYFAGRLIGGPRLSPRWSPKKTWSGFLVGIAAGASAGCLVAPAGSSHAILFGIGLVAAALAQAGDIAESMMKRRFGVKDASNLIPGHGGVMDRLDGFVTATAFACVLGAARSGLDAASSGLLNWF